MRIIYLKERQDTSVVCFLHSLKEKLGKSYCILKASRLTSICIHREKATSVLKVIFFIDDSDKK